MCGNDFHGGLSIAISIKNNLNLGPSSSITDIKPICFPVLPKVSYKSVFICIICCQLTCMESYLFGLREFISEKGLMSILILIIGSHSTSHISVYLPRNCHTDVGFWVGEIFQILGGLIPYPGLIKCLFSTGDSF